MTILRTIKKIALGILIFVIVSSVYMLTSIVAFVGKSIRKFFRKIKH